MNKLEQCNISLEKEINMIAEKIQNNDCFLNISVLVDSVIIHQDELPEFESFIDYNESFKLSEYNIIDGTGTYPNLLVDEDENVIDEFDTKDEAIGYCVDNLIDAPVYYDVLEFWGVSDWLADKLEQENQPLVRGFNLNIWGRTTSGQAISMDMVIQKIAAKLLSKPLDEFTS